MKVYIKFFSLIYLRSLFFVFLVMTSLAFILNLLSELDFFREINVEINFPIFLAFLNSPSMIFEMFPFIFLIAAQLFFIKLFDNKEIESEICHPSTHLIFCDVLFGLYEKLYSASFPIQH